MNIIMVTNTFTPHVGGVARSVEAFTAEYRRAGHRVLVVAPEFEGVPEDEPDVVRLPAIQNFNGSDFSVRIPIPGFLRKVLREFEPEIVHSHHPFLLGTTALRIAASRDVPLVFTHHTMYERYTHYVPGDLPAMRQFVVDLATGYANLCDSVVAPSESVAGVLQDRGVQTPIEVIPTGVDAERFAEGDGGRIRQELGIPAEAFVVGHLGRLAEEKNLLFLAEAVSRLLQHHSDVHFLVAGKGPCEEDLRKVFSERGVADRLHLVGVLPAEKLVDAYTAMDVFAFASQSETQGMVLTEAMAAGVPVVAVDASGVREVVIDEGNGRLLPEENADRFVEALQWVHERSPEERDALHRGALETAERFSMPRCAERMLRMYEGLLGQKPGEKQPHDSLWDKALRRCEAEWEVWRTRAHAAGAALSEERPAGRRSLLSRLADWCRR